jgi:tripartite ATP-independent transporter DctM subunit
MVFLLGLALLLLALLGAPLFTVIGAGALLAFWWIGIDTAAVIIELYRIASAPTLLAIPLFTFAGYLLAESGTPKRLVNLARACFGWLPGGLAVVALATCAVFTAFTGASGVTIIALGGLLLPALLQEAYPEKFSLGLLTTSGSLGLLFPPSLPLILYGLVARTSVDELFIAGVLPGLLLVVLLTLYSIHLGHRAAVPRTPFQWSALARSIRESALEIPLPFIILGGIYGGYFTATEAAAITAFYVLVVEVFFYRDLSLRSDVPRLMRESMILVGGILVILGTALGFTNFLIDQEIPMRLLDLMRQYLTSKITFLIVLNVFLLIVGCLMDIFSAIVVVVPLIVPIAKEFGVDPVHLGIIFLANLEIGYATPPVGINLFIASFRFSQPVVRLYLAALPFLGILVVALLIITYVPDLSLLLVRTMARP